MITLITGMPGNGKTVRAVWLIDSEVRKGRKVYSDIEGLKIDGVEPAPDDWRTVPDGALIVYDEAHRRFPAYRGKGRSPLEVVREMDTHRHRGVDLVIITQWPDKIDGELFRLVGRHEHLNRAMGLQRAGLVVFSRGVMNPYSATARKGADEETWEFPKRLYDLYHSTSHHTSAYKFKLPAKARNALIGIPFMLLALWGVYKGLVYMTGPKEERSEAETTTQAPASDSAGVIAPPAAASVDAVVLLPGTGAYGAVKTEVAPQYAGCVASGEGLDANGTWGQGGCRCFNVDGFQIDLSVNQCQDLLAKPLPINVYHDYATAAVVAREAPAAAGGDLRPAREVSGSVGTVGRPMVDASFGTMTRPAL